MMTKIQHIIVLVSFFSLGLILPVFNLLLLEKGATLQTLPLLLAIYSITVLCLELPSGIFADLYGRKTVFLVSCVFQFICCVLLLTVSNMIGLIFVALFLGLGRAFSSGSLDALFIDDALSRHGDACLAKVTSRMAILEGVGLAVGGITGGIISSMTSTYLTVIYLRLAFTVFLFIICLVAIHEKGLLGIKKNITLLGHLRESKQVLFSSSKFKLLILGVFFVGFFLFSIETYWQPAFIQITNVQNGAWLLGFIVFLGFLAVVIGNTISQKLLDKYSNGWWHIYFILRIIFAGFILIFAFQKNDSGFVAVYSLTYLMLGASSVAENTLINKMTPSHMRASVLSLSSLILQIGGLSASLFSSLLILKVHFTGLWIVAGGLLGVYAIIVLLVIKKLTTINT